MELESCCLVSCIHARLYRTHIGASCCCLVPVCMLDSILLHGAAAAALCEQNSSLHTGNETAAAAPWSMLDSILHHGNCCCCLVSMCSRTRLYPAPWSFCCCLVCYVHARLYPASMKRDCCCLVSCVQARLYPAPWSCCCCLAPVCMLDPLACSMELLLLSSSYVHA